MKLAIMLAFVVGACTAPGYRNVQSPSAYDAPAAYSAEGPSSYDWQNSKLRAQQHAQEREDYFRALWSEPVQR